MQLDADTSMSPGSFEAALRAIGGATRAVDEVVSKKAANAFVAQRPPGHHAETVAADGLLHLQPAPRSPRAMPRRSTACIASPWSISTCITATARRRSSGPTRR